MRHQSERPYWTLGFSSVTDLPLRDKSAVRLVVVQYLAYGYR